MIAVNTITELARNCGPLALAHVVARPPRECAVALSAIREAREGVTPVRSVNVEDIIAALDGYGCEATEWPTAGLTVGKWLRIPGCWLLTIDGGGVGHVIGLRAGRAVGADGYGLHVVRRAFEVAPRAAVTFVKCDRCGREYSTWPGSPLSESECPHCDYGLQPIRRGM